MKKSSLKCKISLAKVKKCAIVREVRERVSCEIKNKQQTKTQMTETIEQPKVVVNPEALLAQAEALEIEQTERRGRKFKLEAYRPTIAVLLKKGATYKQIHSFLTKNGVQVHFMTLANEAKAIRDAEKIPGDEEVPDEEPAAPVQAKKGK